MIPINKNNITKTSKETQLLGEVIGKNLRNGTIFALSGDLGAGKTTFVQGMAKGIGIKKRIISPSFVIIRTYKIPKNQAGVKNFYHIDLYRIESEKEVKGLGLKEILQDSSNIVAIEWAEKAPALSSYIEMEIHFQYITENTRKITFLKH